MKKLIIAVLALGFAVVAVAEPPQKEEEKPPDKAFECPYSRISDQDKCFRCHGEGRDFLKIKETDPHALYDYPVNLIVLEDEQGKIGYYSLKDQIGDYTPRFLEEAFRYLYRHGIDRMLIDIDSPGGSVFAGWKTVSVIQQWQSKGIEVATQVRNIAASAAFTIFCAADKRLISPTAENMQHELWTFTFLSFDTPSDSEHKAKVLRHIQETITVWLASRVGMTKEELSEKIKKKEYWMNGAQAIGYGWATDYVTVPSPELEAALLEQVEAF